MNRVHDIAGAAVKRWLPLDPARAQAMGTPGMTNSRRVVSMGGQATISANFAVRVSAT